MGDNNNSWDQYQKLVLSKLDDLKQSVDATNTHLWTHVKEANQKFEDIHIEMASTKAAQEATASGSAKFWAAVGGGASLLLGILGDWLLFGRGK